MERLPQSEPILEKKQIQTEELKGVLGVIGAMELRINKDQLTNGEIVDALKDIRNKLKQIFEIS